MAIKIITDSTSDISKQLIEEFDIGVLSLNVTFGEENIQENEISNEDFYKKMEAEGIPISSQPAVGVMMEKMKNVLEAGDDLICIFLSSGLSGTYQSALLVKDVLTDDYPDSKIEIIDSGSTSMALGYTVLEGARLAKEKASFEEVVSKVEETVDRIKFIFIPDNMDYLHKGGRIGGAQALFGNVFKITPILTVENKEVAVLGTVRTKKRAKDNLIKILLEDNEKYQVKEVCVHHINAKEEAQLLKEALEAVIDVPVIIGDIGPVIGLHVGPGSVGLAYRTTKKIDYSKE